MTDVESVGDVGGVEGVQFNTLKPAAGSKRAAKRVGRGNGAGTGKTCGRGQKGQKSRSGSSMPPWFEGGQLPLQMRVPKFGFRSRIGMSTAEVRLGDLEKALDRVSGKGAVKGSDGDVVDLQVLKAANILSRNVKRARIMLSGTIGRAVTVKDLGVTRGARAAIEAAGGRIEGAEDRAN